MQIRPNEIGAMQIGSREIGCAIASTWTKSVRAAVPLRVLPAGLLSDQCAGPVKQDVDVATTRADVQRQKGVRSLIREALHLVPSLAQLRVKRAGRLERQRVSQVPQQLVQCLDDGNDGEHSLRYLWIPPPILPGERRLGDLLPGAVTVVGGATGKAAFSQLAVDAASEVRLQMRTGLARGLVDREVGRRSEWQGNTTQPGTVLAVWSKVRTILAHTRPPLGGSRAP